VPGAGKTRTRAPGRVAYADEEGEAIVVDVTSTAERQIRVLRGIALGRLVGRWKSCSMGVEARSTCNGREE